MRVLVVNGPNLDLLGTREPTVYGSTTLADLEADIAGWGEELGMEMTSVQSNHEGDLVEAIHAAVSHDAIVINPGALTHTSRALADAIAAVSLPAVEVHISNVKAREEWRRHSVISPVAVRTIYGRGPRGYRDALRHLAARNAFPFETIRYGPHPEHVGDLRLVEGSPGMVVLVHGGYLLQEWERDTIDSLAVDLATRGYSTWNIEYRRLGCGGGWPASAHDVQMALDFAWGLDGEPATVAVGHSAGGFLTLWAGTRAMPLAATVGLSALTDLAAVIEAGSVGNTVAAELVASGCPPRLAVVPANTTLFAAGEDEIVDSAQSVRLEGDAAVEVVPGLTHFDLLDPSKAHWPGVVEIVDAALAAT